MHADLDYQPLNEIIEFNIGSGVGTMAPFDVIINNDTIVEELIETFTVMLTTPTGAPVVVASPESVTVSVLEDLTDSTSACSSGVSLQYWCME